MGNKARGASFKHMTTESITNQPVRHAGGALCVLILVMITILAILFVFIGWAAPSAAVDVRIIGALHLLLCFSVIPITKEAGLL